MPGGSGLGGGYGSGLDWWSYKNKLLHRESRAVDVKWNGGTKDHATTRDDMIDDEMDEDKTELHFPGCACIGPERMCFVLFPFESTARSISHRLFVCLSSSCLLPTTRRNHQQKTRGILRP